MESPQPDRIDLLAVMLVDLRATVDAEKRAIVNAQASAEEYRVARDRQSLTDISEALGQLNDHVRMLSDGLKEATKVLRAVRAGATAPGSEPSGV